MLRVRFFIYIDPEWVLKAHFMHRLLVASTSLAAHQEAGQPWYPAGDLILLDGKVERLRLLGVSRHEVFREDGGVFACSYANECSEVCPKNVDPAAAVNQAKFRAVIDWATGLVLPRGGKE